MNARMGLLLVLLAAHAVVTGVAVSQHGPWETLISPFGHSGTVQVFSDLCVALLLVTSWIRADAKARGKSWVPWFVLTLATGSFAPLTYLLLREREKVRERG